jgi:hypothetical protein
MSVMRSLVWRQYDIRRAMILNAADIHSCRKGSQYRRYSVVVKVLNTADIHSCRKSSQYLRYSHLSRRFSIPQISTVVVKVLNAADIHSCKGSQYRRYSQLS